MNQMTILSTDSMPAHLAAAGSLGNENIDADTLATPYLKLLQSLSEQAVKGNPKHITGASAGMFLNSINNDLYEELWVSNLFMTRRYNVNKKRIFGVKDWRGSFDSVDAAMAKLTEDGVNPADYDISDTHIHTLAIIDPVKGTIVSPVQYLMQSSALRDSRAWNANIVTNGPSVPRFASIWKLTAKLNTSNKGSWYTPQVQFAGWAPKDLYDQLQTLFHGLRGQDVNVEDV